MIIRYSMIAGGAALPTQSTANSGSGQDLQCRLIKRVLSAAEIGANAGQTKHIGGCLAVSFTGGPLITQAVLLRVTDAVNISKDALGQKLIVDSALGTIRVHDAGDPALAGTDILWILAIFAPR